MKKIDIVTAIENSPLVAELIEQPDPVQIGDMRTYEWKALIGSAEKGYRYEAINFRVVREGQNDEAAYWGAGVEASITPKADTFESQVVAAAEQAKTGGAILAYKIDSVDEDSKVVEATAWVDNNGTPVEKKYLAYDNNGLQFRQL